MLTNSKVKQSQNSQPVQPQLELEQERGGVQTSHFHMDIRGKQTLLDQIIINLNCLDFSFRIDPRNSAGEAEERPENVLHGNFEAEAKTHRSRVEVGGRNSWVGERAISPQRRMENRLRWVIAGELNHVTYFVQSSNTCSRFLPAR